MKPGYYFSDELGLLRIIYPDGGIDLYFDDERKWRVGYVVAGYWKYFNYVGPL